ncbi:MAG: hypothetical protein GEV28_23025 [Actinophytocola sp.]|uniref:hypothetical protein n=1 Tax=Actinophytocola sp. TaxID=1872138 RepID=UPI0013219D89|nr:hypothetical protein [Actinophytocola sp.]MPZ83107.1 hypothetical protein [Actinophytocola sp.]
MTEWDALIETAGRRCYLWHMFRMDRHGPELLAGVYQWRDCADVVVLFDDQHAHAYRIPTDENTDVFTPTHVYWWYGANPVWTMRALLTLPAPGHPDAPDTLTPAPPGTGIPGDRMPVRMRRRGWR